MTVYKSIRKYNMLLPLMTFLNRRASGTAANTIVSGLAAVVRLAPLIIAVIVLILVAAKFTSCSDVFFKEKEILRIENENKSDIIADAVVANKKATEAIAILNKANELNVATIIDNVNKEKVISDSALSKNAVVKEKIAQIKDDYKQLPVTPVNMKIKEDAVSAILIDSIWSAYCEAAAKTTCGEN